ncbi:MAG: hypothetical protein ACOYOV_17510 [Bacteroidales bacterium]
MDIAQPKYDREMLELRTAQQLARELNEINLLEDLEIFVRNLLKHEIDTGMAAEKVRTEAKSVLDSIRSKIDRLYISFEKNNFDNFIDEVFNLEIKIKELYVNPNGSVEAFFPDEVPYLPRKKVSYLSLNHYNQFESDYEYKLKKIQQRAITDLIKLTPDQITLQINRLTKWEDRFTRFWKWHNAISRDFREGNLRFIDFEIKIESFFNVPKYTEAIISQDFIHDLHDAAMFKHSYLTGFISQVNELLKGSTSTDNPKSAQSVIDNYKFESTSSKFPVSIDKADRVIKFFDYLPLYGYLWQEEYPLIINGVEYSMVKLFELNDNENIELSEIHIEMLNHYDRMSFQKKIAPLNTEPYMIEFFRDTLDEYKINGGDPVFWIKSTLDDMDLNYSNYPAIYRGLIQKNLLEWLEFYIKANKYNVNETSNINSSSDDTLPTSLSKTKDTSKKIPEKWYAFYHMILIRLSKENQFLDTTKKGIIALGAKKYGTDQGFYRGIKNIDLNNMPAYIKSMTSKDRNKWKSLIIELSENDADVISWVNKQPK